MVEKKSRPKRGTGFAKDFLRDATDNAGQLLLIRSTTLPSVKTLSPVCSSHFITTSYFYPAFGDSSHLSILPFGYSFWSASWTGRAIGCAIVSSIETDGPSASTKHRGLSCLRCSRSHRSSCQFLLPWRTLSPWREDTPLRTMRARASNIFLLYFLLRTRNGERGQEKDKGERGDTGETHVDTPLKYMNGRAVQQFLAQ